jgi:hypothetical protein
MTIASTETIIKKAQASDRKTDEANKLKMPDKLYALEAIVKTDSLRKNVVAVQDGVPMI